MVGSRIIPASSARHDAIGRRPARFAAAELRAESIVGRAPSSPAIFSWRSAAVLRSWRVLGPFDATAGSGPDVACIPETQEQDLGGEFVAAEGTITAKQKTAPTNILTLPNRPYSAWYAYKEVRAAEAVETQLLIGSDDDIKVWVNGQTVHRNQIKRSVSIDHDVVRVSLREGVNRILIKVINGDGDCGFVVRIRDTGGVVSWTDD